MPSITFTFEIGKVENGEPQRYLLVAGAQWPVHSVKVDVTEFFGTGLLGTNPFGLSSNSYGKWLAEGMKGQCIMTIYSHLTSPEPLK